MSTYDWVMAFGALFVIGLVLKGFWVADKTDSIEQPDNWQQSDPPNDGAGHHH
jgi:hypothetical protein